MFQLDNDTLFFIAKKLMDSFYDINITFTLREGNRSANNMAKMDSGVKIHEVLDHLIVKVQHGSLPLVSPRGPMPEILVMKQEIEDWRTPLM